MFKSVWVCKVCVGTGFAVCGDPSIPCMHTYALHNTTMHTHSHTHSQDRGYSSDCDLPPGMQVYGNSVCTPSATLSVCGNVPLTQWVARGHDPGTSLHGLPADDELVSVGARLLNIKV